MHRARRCQRSNRYDKSVFAIILYYTFHSFKWHCVLKVVVNVPVVLCKCVLALAKLYVVCTLFSTGNSAAAVPGTCHTTLKTISATIMNEEQWSPFAVKKAFNGTI